MASQDLDRARSRFIAAVKRFIEGARLERKWILATADSSPRLLEGTTCEVVNLTGLPGNDVDYYVYEWPGCRMPRGRSPKVFDQPPEVVDVLTAFDATVPNLCAARNPLTHASDDARLDEVGWFSALVRLRPNGDVGYLGDPPVTATTTPPRPWPPRCARPPSCRSSSLIPAARIIRAMTACAGAGDRRASLPLVSRVLARGAACRNCGSQRERTQISSPPRPSPRRERHGFGVLLPGAM